MAKAPEMRGFEEAVDQGTKMPRGEHKYEAGWCGEPERILTVDDLRLGQIPSAGVERGLEKSLALGGGRSGGGTRLFLLAEHGRAVEGVSGCLTSVDKVAEE